ncbi:YtzC family protein [Cytobacillus sp. Hm23]|uniref:YtzC family protein n=1 Tax=Bacillaceae TaxID=186817 RepID=UPI002A10D110|nr:MULTISPECIES: YtzC family protein [unclassified Cytobacillus]MDX8359222.1 YtzC family protein [Cytobacillus sp. IB215316]MDX8367457.1 YtzC family protein [Cytobacillus sp. IB215665]
MATRQSVQEFIHRCEETLNFAEEQLTEARRQEHYNDYEFSQAQQQLENANNDLAHLALSCNAQQKEQLHRMRLQIQELQNEMILQDH